MNNWTCPLKTMSFICSDMCHYQNDYDMPITLLTNHS